MEVVRHLQQVALPRLRQPVGMDIHRAPLLHKDLGTGHLPLMPIRLPVLLVTHSPLLLAVVTTSLETRDVSRVAREIMVNRDNTTNSNRNNKDKEHMGNIKLSPDTQRIFHSHRPDTIKQGRLSQWVLIKHPILRSHHLDTTNSNMEVLANILHQADMGDRRVPRGVVQVDSLDLRDLHMAANQEMLPGRNIPTNQVMLQDKVIPISRVAVSDLITQTNKEVIRIISLLIPK